MLKKFISNVKVFIFAFFKTFAQFKKQYAFELKNITTCSKTGRHLVEVKIIGKGQSILCVAQDILSDADFIVGFSQKDVSLITSYAISDQYESFIYQEKIKKAYEIIRSKNQGGKKTVLIRHKLTGDSIIKSLSDFADEDLINHLESKDAYYLGYQAGQEQTFRDFARLKAVSSKKSEKTEN